MTRRLQPDCVPVHVLRVMADGQTRRAAEIIAALDMRGLIEEENTIRVAISSLKQRGLLAVVDRVPSGGSSAGVYALTDAGRAALERL